MGNAIALPAMPNIPLLFHSIIYRRCLKFEWADPPEEYFPDARSVDSDTVHARKDFFVSALIVSYASYSLVAIVVTIIRNKIVEGRQQREGYSSVLTKFAEHEILVSALRSPWLAFFIINMHSVGVAALLLYCVHRNSVSRATGVAWEFWLIWLNCNLAVGLIELTFSVYLPGKRDVTLYPKVVLLSHLPLLSEKMDTTKDWIFCAIAARIGDLLLGAVCAVLLMAAQVYFCFKSEIRGELLETYLPLLSSPVHDESTSVIKVLKERGMAAAFKSEKDKARKFLYKTLLKQSAPSRWYIALIEDAPQGVAMTKFSLDHNGSIFVVASLGISVFRLFLASPFVGRFLFTYLKGTIQEERKEAVLSNNAAKVIALTLILWKGDPEMKALELREVSLTVADLLSEGFSPKQIFLGGYAKDELTEGGINCVMMRECGVSLQQIKEAGFTCAEAKLAEFACTEMKEVQYTLPEIKEAGFTCKEAKDAGYLITEVKKAGYTCREAKDGGYTASNVKEAGYSCPEVKDADFALTDIKKAGYTCKEVRDAGFALIDAKEAGFTCTDMKNAKFTLTEILGAGASCSELKNAKFTLKEMRQAGVTCEATKEAFTIQDVKEAGYTCKEVAKAGWACSDAREVGYKLNEIVNSGYLSTELQSAGFDFFDVAYCAVTPNMLRGDWMKKWNGMKDQDAFGTCQLGITHWPDDYEEDTRLFGAEFRVMTCKGVGCRFCKEVLR